MQGNPKAPGPRKGRVFFDRSADPVTIDGQGMNVDEAFNPIRAELLRMKKSGRSKAGQP
jgi:hypothetical protein